MWIKNVLAHDNYLIHEDFLNLFLQFYVDYLHI